MYKKSWECKALGELTLRYVRDITNYEKRSKFTRCHLPLISLRERTIVLYIQVASHKDVHNSPRTATTVLVTYCCLASGTVVSLRTDL